MIRYNVTVKRQALATARTDHVVSDAKSALAQAVTPPSHCSNSRSCIARQCQLGMGLRLD